MWETLVYLLMSLVRYLYMKNDRFIYLLSPIILLAIIFIFFIPTLLKIIKGTNFCEVQEIKNETPPKFNLSSQIITVSTIKLTCHPVSSVNHTFWFVVASLSHKGIKQYFPS